MTNNKMPVVGERYRKQEKSYKCVGLNLISTNYYFKMLRDGADLSREYNLSDFYEFEPIPQGPISQPSIPKEERLPEVGKEYIFRKDKGWNGDKIIAKEIKEDENVVIYECYEDGDLGREYLNKFWNTFEEIPNNSQKPSEVQVKQSVLSDEVRKAMEEVKKVLFERKISLEIMGGTFLYNKFQNLLDSLESMDKPNMPERGDCGIVEEDCELEQAADEWNTEEYKPKCSFCKSTENLILRLADKEQDNRILCLKCFRNNQPEEEKKSEEVNRFSHIRPPLNDKGFIEYDFKNINYPKSAKESDMWHLRSSKMQTPEEMDKLVCIEDTDDGNRANFMIIQTKFADLASGGVGYNGYIAGKVEEEKKSEEEKPKSIWKDVKELPKGKNFDVLYKFRSSRILMVSMAINGGEYDFEQVEKICTLTDLINAFEDLQEQVNKLETKEVKQWQQVSEIISKKIKNY